MTFDYAFVLLQQRTWMVYAVSWLLHVPNHVLSSGLWRGARKTSMEPLGILYISSKNSAVANLQKSGWVRPIFLSGINCVSVLFFFNLEKSVLLLLKKIDIILIFKNVILIFFNGNFSLSGIRLLLKSVYKLFYPFTYRATSFQP